MMPQIICMEKSNNGFEGNIFHKVGAATLNAK